MSDLIVLLVLGLLGGVVLYIVQTGLAGRPDRSRPWRSGDEAGRDEEPGLDDGPGHDDPAARNDGPGTVAGADADSEWGIR